MHNLHMNYIGKNLSHSAEPEELAEDEKWVGENLATSQQAIEREGKDEKAAKTSKLTKNF